MISKGKPIPASLAKRFFALQQTDKQIATKRNRIEIPKKVKTGIEKTMKYFNEYEDYLFSGTAKEQYREFSVLHIFNDIDRAVKEHDVSYSFKEMITTAINSYLLIGEHLNLDRDGMILYFFEIVDDYCGKRVPTKDFSKYRRRVVAAFLTMTIAEIPLWKNKIKSFRL